MRAVDERRSLDANITRTFLKTRTSLSTGQTLDAKINPDSYSLSIGYMF